MNEFRSNKARREHKMRWLTQDSSFGGCPEFQSPGHKPSLGSQGIDVLRVIISVHCNSLFKRSMEVQKKTYDEAKVEIYDSSALQSRLRPKETQAVMCSELEIL